MEDIRGVNLGGWLVLERWISPSVFKGTRATDEYSLIAELGYERASRRLQAHRETFITEKHIASIHRLGLSVVRLPVGYWLFDDQDGYVGGADEYVNDLFIWASHFGLKVILCLHAAPGSQNGWDHSGRAGVIAWSESSNIKKTYNFLLRLVERYGQEDSLIGIEVVNEPHWSIPLSTLLDFYGRAGRMIERVCRSGTQVIVSDAFRPKDMSKRIVKLGVQNIVMDCHMYQLFTDEDRALDISGHLQKAHDWETELKRYSKQVPILIGEWSAAMSELYNLSGLERPIPYSMHDYISYAHMQRQAFRNAGVGWCYWTARTEDGGIWSLLDHPELLKNT